MSRLTRLCVSRTWQPKFLHTPMERIDVQIKRIGSAEDAFTLPQYMTEGSAGMDLRAAVDEELILGPLDRIMVPTGIALALPTGFEAQIRPRSGLAFNQGLTLVNSPGTVDSDYRGEVQVLVVNLSKEPVTIHPGQRIAQMVVQRVVRVSWKEVDELPLSKRGTGGFGHTE